MKKALIGNYIKVLRRKAGLSQRDLARLLGYRHAWQVSRHERSLTTPPLLIAVAYQELFQEPLPAIFTGIYASVVHMVEANVASFKKDLDIHNSGGAGSPAVVQKLKWLAARKQHL